jgi:MFS family permease
VSSIQLGLRANAARFSLLVGLNALVGAMVGLERSVLPLVGKRDFHLTSDAAVLAFVVAFGLAKALANLTAGALADRIGRKRLLVLGWLFALPVAPLVALAPSWWLVVVANVLLGANQGLAWSMTVVMKIDLVGPARRGLALGLNESAGYLGLAATAFASGALAASVAPRTVVWTGALAIALAGTFIAAAFVRDTGLHVAHEQAGHGERKAMSLPVAFVETTMRQPVLRSCSQAGFVNNLNDALAWGLVPLYLAAHRGGTTRIGVVAAVYPCVWALLQVPTGWFSDYVGRKPLIVLGMLVQGGALAVLVSGGGRFAPALAAAVLLGIGTALVYPTLIAAVSDVVQPRDRAAVVGVYRFWRDSGFVAGALLVGFAADALGSGWAIAIVAALTGASGLLVAGTPWREHRSGRWLLSATSSWSIPVPFVRSEPNRCASVEGGVMRAIECPCGHHLEGADDQELFRLARQHVDRDHPEMQRTDDELRARIAADAYEA